MDIVLGVSLAPDSVQMVLLQGENADGTTVDDERVRRYRRRRLAHRQRI